MGAKFPLGVDVQGSRVSNVADASSPTDAPNLAQVQAFVRGRAYKDAVRAASTANINLASPGASIDGVTLAVNDRVLIKNQTTGSENGIYIWTSSTSTLTRSADADSPVEVVGATVGVLEGSTLADTRWVQTADNVTLGTTGLTFVRDNGGGPAYTAGNGLALNGTEFTVKPKPSSGITVTSDGVAIDTAIVVRKLAGTLGNGAATSFGLVHGFGNIDVMVVVRDASTGERVFPDDVAGAANTVTVSFKDAPGSNAYRWAVFG